MAKETLIAIRRYDIAKPEQVKNMAVVLKDYITKNGLAVDIQGKKYCMVEGWEFAGFLTGIMPIIESVMQMSTANEIKWMATVNLVKEGQKVGIGMALCSNKEGKKKSFDEYAILSMAQTRAIGKAYRNMFGWVMKLAGYESVPAEEVATPKKDMFSEAEKLIANAKTQGQVMKIVERIEASDKFTADQKKTLGTQASNKIDVLESQNDKKGKK